MATQPSTDGSTPTSAATNEHSLTSIYESAKLKSCKVGNLSIDGAVRTKPEIIEREFENIHDAQNLQEVNDALLSAYGELMDLDVFEAVEVFVDQSDKGEGYCDVNVTVKEKGLVSFKAGTYVQGTEGSMELEANLINPMGHSERFTASAEYGMQRSSTFALGLSKPRPFGRRGTASVSLHQKFHDNERWSSYTELVRGGVATMTSHDGRNSLAYELAWRRLADPSRLASHSVMSQLGDQLKSAVTHTFINSTMEGESFPTSGSGVRVTTEISGLGTDSNLLRFIKEHVMYGAAFPVGSSSSLVLSGEAGLMLPLGRGCLSRPTSICDRFFLGGIGSLRGFQQKGVGVFDARRPKTGDEGAAPEGRVSSGQDALGGDLVLAGGVALNFPLPVETLRNIGAFGQLFVNGGSISTLTGGGSVKESLRQFSTSFRWSVGAGLVLPLQVGRLEVNVCRILSRQPQDRAKHGIQFGLTPNIW